MKKLIFLFLLFPNLVFSQDLLSKFEALKQELNYVDSIGQSIKSVSISPSGNWVILYGQYGFSYNFLPKSALTYLNKQNSEQSKIKDFDFLGSDTAWVGLTKNNAYAFKFAPTELANGLKNLNSQQVSVYQLSFLQNKWALVYDRGKILYQNLPQTAVNAIKNLQSQNRLIKYAAFYEPNGWILLYGKNEFSSEGIPVECETELKALKSKDAEINLVVFFNQAWLIIYNEHKFTCNF